MYKKSKSKTKAAIKGSKYVPEVSTPVLELPFPSIFDQACPGAPSESTFCLAEQDAPVYRLGIGDR